MGQENSSEQAPPSMRGATLQTDAARNNSALQASVTKSRGSSKSLNTAAANVEASPKTTSSSSSSLFKSKKSSKKSKMSASARSASSCDVTESREEVVKLAVSWFNFVVGNDCRFVK